MYLFFMAILAALAAYFFIFRGRRTKPVEKDDIETNRALGMNFQDQGLYDLAFEKFRKCPLDDETRDLIYNLGLDYERKRMINKAVSVYEYINTNDKGFRDLNERIPKLKKALGSYKGRAAVPLVVTDDLGVKPTVGRYEILTELARGAAGAVYKGRDPKRKPLVAVKILGLSDEFEEDKVKEIKDRFFREAESAGSLSHPGIVAIYDAGEDYDLTFIVMEFLKGENIEKYCRKGSLLPIRKALDVVAETAEALEYMHSRGVIHRDIKPAHIMLLTNGRIKVIGFEIAEWMARPKTASGVVPLPPAPKTRSGIVLGTPEYLSPEQIVDPQLDARSDIFSLGVVFFQLLTGELPFKAEDLNSLLRQITHQRHPSVREIDPNIPPMVERIIDRALSKDVGKRYQRAGQMAGDIQLVRRKI
jgi:serine/threonine protein kinase